MGGSARRVDDGWCRGVARRRSVRRRGGSKVGAAPRPVDGPAITHSHVAVLESRLDRGDPGDAHQPETRRAMARALAEQIEILRSARADLAALSDAPAWAAYEEGPWPVPHDPIFDFTTTPPGLEWLDRLAR